MARTQLARLVQLLLMLQEGRGFNARDLAKRCEVSSRTIYRDLDTLEQAGVPIRYLPERQGYQLAPSFTFDGAALSEEEAIGLALLAHSGAHGGNFTSLRQARRGIVKLALSLPAEAREHVLALAEVVGDGKDVPEPDSERSDVHDAVLDGIRNRLQLRIWYYERRGSADVDVTKFSPYRLVSEFGLWMLIGRSTVHRAVRKIPLCRIVRAILTDDRYSVPPRFSVERALTQSDRPGQSKERVEVWIRFSPHAAAEIRDRIWHPSQKLERLEDGRVDLRCVVDEDDALIGWILGFGDHAEVLSPAKLRARIHEIAGQIAQRHLDVPLTPGEEVPGGVDRTRVREEGLLTRHRGGLE
jgi:proteasome accessory factor B